MKSEMSNCLSGIEKITRAQLTNSYHSELSRKQEDHTKRFKCFVPTRLIQLGKEEEEVEEEEVEMEEEDEKRWGVGK